MKILGTLSLSNGTAINFLTPLIQIERVKRIIIVRNSPGPKLPKVRYVCPPKITNKFVFTRIISKLLLMIYLIIKEKPKLIISFYMKAYGIIALLSGKITNVPVNLNIISGPEEYQLLRINGKDYRLKLMEKTLLYLTKYSNAITTTGTKTKEYLVHNGIRKDIIDILPDSIDLDRFHPMPMEKKYDILIVGRCDPAKRLENFLQIVSRLKAKKSGIKAALRGDGPLKNSLERLSRELEIQNNVEFLGYQDNVEVYYNASKIFVLTSEREGLPMAVHEAMGCGLPCVISNVGDIPDLAVDGFNSIVIQNYDDIDGYVDAIINLLEDKDFYDTMSMNAYKTVRERYSYENAKNVWEKILKKLAVS